MRERVFGIETEYAVIHHPGRRETPRPTNLEIYGLFESRLGRHLASLPRAFSLLRSKPGRFLENGASFHYEATPKEFEHGLLEMASPECRDPFTLLCCERAKDALVETLCREVNLRLAGMGYSGEVRIGKNNVDSQGHTFGSHESYWVEDPLPLRRKLLLLPLWIVLWILSLPVFAWLLLAVLGILCAVLAVFLVPGVGMLLSALSKPLARVQRSAALGLRRAAARLAAVPRRLIESVQSRPGEVVRRLSWIELPLRPLISLHSWMHNRFHFQRFHRHLTAFLVTRTLFTGAGCVVLDGGPPFRLAQRPPFLRSLARVFTSGENRPLYESRDVFFRPWSALGSRRRLHLMIGDANLCDWALVLRTGATALVLEAIETGASASWPEMVDPLRALRALSADPELGLRYRLSDGSELSALEIQRRYLDGVRAALAAEIESEGWKSEVMAMWEETLDLLERDPDELRDRIDWVAKRSLIRREIPDPADWEAIGRQGSRVLRAPPASAGGDSRLRDLAFRALRADLRYHELGPRGGHRHLEHRGELRKLAEPERVDRARLQPPTDTRALARGRAIREAHSRSLAGAATWHRVRLGRFDWRWYPDPLDPGTAPS
ncbi:MAG: proteasome accessory factor PafA2 family protein [Myxococcota bacterium]|nr:proteasome accessory factor PafA2 family protein [Myxococcota bacterium]